MISELVKPTPHHGDGYLPLVLLPVHQRGGKEDDPLKGILLRPITNPPCRFKRFVTFPISLFVEQIESQSDRFSLVDWRTCDVELPQCKNRPHLVFESLQRRLQDCLCLKQEV